MEEKQWVKKELKPFIEPSMPIELLLAQQKGTVPCRAVVVGAHRPEILKMVSAAEKLGLITPILVGLKGELREAAHKAEFDLENVETGEAENEKKMVEIATSILQEQKCEMAIKGHIHSDVYLRGLLRSSAGLRTQTSASHVFHMSAPGLKKPLFITDAAFNISPDVNQRKATAENAINFAHKLGVTCPKVAVLSASETIMPAMPSTLEAAEIVEWINDRFSSSAHAFGPVALDLALSSVAAKTKGYEDIGAGDADILLVRDIEMGNALFKMMTYFMGACAAGVVTGLKIPLVLTSRADPMVAKLASIALAARISSTSK